MKMVEKRMELNKAIKNEEGRRTTSRLLKEYRELIKEEGFEYGFINNKESVYKKENDNVIIFDEETCQFNKL